MHELRRRTHAPNIPAITAAVRQAVARQHGLDAYVVALVKPGAILKTTSGKIRRQDCRAAFLAGTFPVIVSSVQAGLELPELPSRATLAAQPAQQRRAVLLQALQELVASRTQLGSDGIDADTQLNSVGLDSLAALELQHVLSSPKSS
jgi:nonribosomal peptide synthetase protein BlmVI